MVLFYTLPPRRVPWSRVLINANRPERGFAYLYTHHRHVDSVVIDSGVEVFRDENVKEYGGGADAAVRRQVMLYERLRRLLRGADIMVTCPDYPDDYHPRALWLSEDMTNIERTLLNVLKCVDWYPDIPWLIPVQGWWRRPESLLISLEYYEQLGILKRWRRLAVANLCVEVRGDVIARGVKYVHHWLAQHGYRGVWLHVFGLKVAALSRLRGILTSFDSVAWTRPLTAKLYRRGNWSAKSEAERELFFCVYIDRLRRKGVEVPGEALRWCGENTDYEVYT